MDKKMRYVEPENYIPEEIQKKYGVGKYYREEGAEEITEGNSEESPEENSEESADKNNDEITKENTD
ncbi:MAG: hypothetical protein II696_01980, partial [Firmicutes bacterium]|nr:hypothetical protein [Bacillota bacterium]